MAKVKEADKEKKGKKHGISSKHQKKFYKLDSHMSPFPSIHIRKETLAQKKKKKKTINNHVLPHTIFPGICLC